MRPEYRVPALQTLRHIIRAEHAQCGDALDGAVTLEPDVKAEIPPMRRFAPKVINPIAGRDPPLAEVSP